MELADIFRRYGPLYLEKYGTAIPPGHIKAMVDISSCRTALLGGHLDRCEQCGYTHFFFNSCYNRSCPKCQGNHAKEWLENRENQRLPVKYFHLVFTVPKQLHPIIRSKPRELLHLLVKAAAYSLNKLMQDPRYAGGKPAMICVIHTWTRTLGYHPHVHILVPGVVICSTSTYNTDNTDNGNDNAGGTEDKDKDKGKGKGKGSKKRKRLEWKLIRKRKFLVPFQPLATIFRARFIKMARKNFPAIANQFPGQIWKKQWVILCKPTLKGAGNVLQYLARYVYRVAITNNRILTDKNGEIKFKYKRCNAFKWKTLPLQPMEFIRRFLQHVLPKGFHKIRYYGFLAPACRHIFQALKLALLKKYTNPNNQLLILKDSQDSKDSQNKKHPHHTRTRICPKCKKGNWVVIGVIGGRKNKTLLSRPPPPP